jgi:hypothetical protein
MTSSAVPPYTIMLSLTRVAVWPHRGFGGVCDGTNVKRGNGPGGGEAHGKRWPVTTRLPRVTPAAAEATEASAEAQADDEEEAPAPAAAPDLVAGAKFNRACLDLELPSAAAASPPPPLLLALRSLRLDVPARPVNKQMHM